MTRNVENDDNNDDDDNEKEDDDDDHDEDDDELHPVQIMGLNDTRLTIT